MILEKIHAEAERMVIYADLGGRSARVISHCAHKNPLVVILDHHLPESALSKTILHLNPEMIGISGDAEASAATATAIYGIELLKEASLLSSPEETLLSVDLQIE